MTESTTSLANAFFTQNAFLSRVDGGFLPANEVVLFHRAWDWNKDTASQKLAPLISRTWFAEALLPRLSFGPMEEEQGIGILAGAAAAEPRYRANIKLLIDYLEAGGLLVRDGGQLRTTRIAMDGAAVAAEGGATANGSVAETPATGRGAIATTFSAPAESGVRFQVAVDVNMDEMGGWSPERITAFFGGIAQVLAAKGAIEKKAGTQEK
jgi:hypothetical protein